MERISPPSITLAIPAYKTPSTLLRRCLDCAVKQKYKNLEILVSDQSPDDEVKKVVEECQAVDKRVK